MRSSVIPFFLLILSAELSAQFSLPDEFWYPDEAIENKVQGKVYVQFTATPTGEILDSTVQIAKGLGYGLDEIAIKVVQDATQLGRNYITQLKKDELTKYVVPVVFVIWGKHWANYYYKKGMKEHELGNYDQAIKLFNESIGFIEDDPRYFYALYSSHSQLGKVDVACSNLKTAKKLDKSFKTEWESKCK